MRSRSSRCPEFYIGFGTLIIYFSFHFRMHTVSSELSKNFSDIPVNADRLLFNLSRADGLPPVDADVGGFGVSRCHLPEGIFNNSRGVISHAEFQKYYFQVFMSPQKLLISLLPGATLHPPKMCCPPGGSCSWVCRNGGSTEPILPARYVSLRPPPVLQAPHPLSDNPD